MTDCRKSTFFLSKKAPRALSSQIWWKRMTKQNENHVTKPKFSKIGLFSRQIFELRKNESRNPLIFSVKRVLLLCFTFWVTLIKFFRSVFEKNVNKHYKMAWNYKTDSYITTPWHVKSSESNISTYYKASTLSYSLRKDGWGQQNKIYAKVLS